MKKLREDPDNFYDPMKRPSGHDIGKGFGEDNKGAIPSNLLQIPNSKSNGAYMSGCKCQVPCAEEELSAAASEGGITVSHPPHPGPGGGGGRAAQDVVAAAR